MKEILMVKTVNGMIPATEEEAEKLKGYKMGKTVRFQHQGFANGKFHRKWWALAKCAFDYWTETAKMPEYKGIEIEPNFDKFRKDLIVSTGRYTIVCNLRGQVMRIADSISYASMDEDQFAEFYKQTVDVIMKEVMSSNLSREELLRWAETFNEFA